MNIHAPNFPIVPPAPKVHEKDLPTWTLLREAGRSSLSLWPKYAFDVPFNVNKALGLTSVLINDPEGIKHVLTTNRANYRRPSSIRRVALPLGGNGLFLSEGADWKRQRHMMSATFTPKHMSLLVPHFQDAAAYFLKGLNGTKADLSRDYQNTALETVLRSLFSLPESPRRQKIDRLVRSYADGPGRPSILDGFAKTDNSFSFALGKRRAFQAKWFAQISAVISQRQDEEQQLDKPRDLLDMLLGLKDADTGEGLSQDEIRDQCATMFFAGSETTARLMFWATYLLTLDQPEQKRIRAEVQAYAPEKVKTLDNLKNWPRLRNVLYEAMRLYPPLPHILRQAEAEDEIMGHKIPKNAQIWISPWILHRHTRFWKEPTSFQPDRFAGIAAPWVQMPGYIPFGAGPRICIGLHFALAEAQIVLAHLFNTYEVHHDGPPVMPIGRISTEPSYAPTFDLKPLR